MNNENSVVKSAYEKAVEKTENLDSSKEENIQEDSSYVIPKILSAEELITLKRKKLKKLRLYKFKKTQAHNRRRKSIAAKSRKKNY